MRQVPGPVRPRLPFLVAVVVVMAGGLVATAVALDRVAQTNPPPRVAAAESPSPTPAPTPSPTPVALVPFADCSRAVFGPPLGPLHPPADVHVYSAPPPVEIDSNKLYLGRLTTTAGVITICLQPALAPSTVNNFVVLARNHFYDGIPFHRVVAGFVIQAGSPACKKDFTDPACTGGGPGYSFGDEPPRQQYVLGAVAMANSGPNTNGSQFFIDIGDNRKGANPKNLQNGLDPSYNLFGKVATGLDVALKTKQGDVITGMTVAEQR